MRKSRPFISVVIRACRRPRGLSNALDSLLAQDCHDIEVVILLDEKGKHRGGNITWANRQFHRYRTRAQGQYVMALDDDGVIDDPAFVSCLKARAAETQADVLLVRCVTLANLVTLESRLLPPDDIWGLDWEGGERPAQWIGNGYNCIAARPLWQKAVAAYIGHERGGDWHYSTWLINSGASFARLNAAVGGRSTMRGRGQTFEQCAPGWFDELAQTYGVVDCGKGDYRLPLWRMT